MAPHEPLCPRRKDRPAADITFASSASGAIFTRSTRCDGLRGAASPVFEIAPARRRCLLSAEPDELLTGQRFHATLHFEREQERGDAGCRKRTGGDDLIERRLDGVHFCEDRFLLG